jgi:uncharacterized protein (TIGR02391 family)
MEKKRILKLVEEILDKFSETDLSSLMSKALIVSKIIEDKEFEKWILLETSGYFNTNPALTQETKVPDYRRLPGQYHDKYGRPLIIEDPDLFQIISNYPVREGVAELEGFAKMNQMLTFRNPKTTLFIKEKLNVEVDTFTFSSNSTISVISEIRNQLISKLIEKRQILVPNTNEIYQTDIASELVNLHPLVQKTAGELYNNGHYRQAILDTYIALVEVVKIKSGRSDLDNTPLMQTVFSEKNPVIRISEYSDEQLGFMWLFSGAVMGIRNPKAHRLIEQKDPQRALEWLSFASVLLRVLDDSNRENQIILKGNQRK